MDNDDTLTSSTIMKCYEDMEVGLGTHRQGGGAGNFPERRSN
jgi:hypothetical protein